MKFDDLIKIVGEEPVFETSLLLAGEPHPEDVRRQLSRWVAAGRLHQLRRGLYTLALPFRKQPAHPFLLANRLSPGSYVTAQSALAYFGMIPEYAASVTSATAGRPAQWETVLGRFLFRHLKPGLMWGYEQVELGGGHTAFVATPEKALLDLFHWQTGGAKIEFIAELRLQNLERLNRERLAAYAQRSRRPKWQRAAQRLAQFITIAPEYQPL